jgi:hypothetical protein
MPPTTPTPTTFSLTGQVTNSTTSTGISGATVSIVDSLNAGKSATTDASGHYSLTGVQPAGFAVTATASGYVLSSKNVTVTSNQTLNFTLVRSFRGSWTGTSTRAGDPARRLRFTVDNANVVTFLNAAFATPACGGYGIDFVVASPTPIDITNRSFTSTYMPSLPPGNYAFTFTTATITGTFTSGATASGTLTVQDYAQPVPAGCSSGTISLVWTATKQ